MAGSFLLDVAGLETPNHQNGSLLAAAQFTRHAGLKAEGGDPLRIAERGPRGIRTLTNNFLRTSREVPTKASPGMPATIRWFACTEPQPDPAVEPEFRVCLG